jgi:hypothetical protein
MTTEEKIIKNKLGLIKLASTLGKCLAASKSWDTHETVSIASGALHQVEASPPGNQPEETVYQDRVEERWRRPLLTLLSRSRPTATPRLNELRRRYLVSPGGSFRLAPHAGKLQESA